jgi:hypothetical protein
MGNNWRNNILNQFTEIKVIKAIYNEKLLINMKEGNIE